MFTGGYLLDLHVRFVACVSCVDFVFPRQQLRQAYAAPVNGGRTSPVVILMVKVGTSGFRAKIVEPCTCYALIL